MEAVDSLSNVMTAHIHVDSVIPLQASGPEVRNQYKATWALDVHHATHVETHIEALTQTLAISDVIHGARPAPVAAS
jgi:hypothetical protein